MKEQDYPWLYQASEQVSGAAQQWYFRALYSQLALFLAVSLLAAIPTWISLGSSVVHRFSIAIAIVLAIGLVFFWTVRGKKLDKRWFDARAAAESAKTLTWRYMMLIPPFQAEDTADDKLLITELEAVRTSFLSSARSMEKQSNIQISEPMRAVRRKTFEERKTFYVSFRAAEQRDWYQKKAVANRGKSNQWFWAVLLVQVIALAWAALRALNIIHMAPTGPLMTVAASFSAWALAKRHDELAMAYAMTAEELKSLTDKVERCSEETEFLGYAGDVEGAISREHTMWRARRNVAASAQGFLDRQEAFDDQK